MKKSASKKLSNKSKVKARHFFNRKKKANAIHKNKKSLKFPNISRIITEKYFFVILILLILVTAISIFGVKLYNDVNQKQTIDKQRLEIAKEVEFWKTVVSEYSDYRDAYFQLALLEYRLGDFKASEFYLEKTLDIDPNFEKGRELEKILNSK